MPEAHVSGSENVVGAMVLGLGDRLREATEAAAGLGGALPAALVALDEYLGGGSIELLAGALRVTHSRAVRVVDRLEAEGLARRRRDPRDRRSVRVELTAAGRRRARRVAAARRRVLGEALAGLSPAARDELAGLAGVVLGELAQTRAGARQVCRLCDVRACGHDEGRCPVTNAVDARQGAS